MYCMWKVWQNKSWFYDFEQTQTMLLLYTAKVITVELYDCCQDSLAICVRYLFCVNVFSHVSQVNIITAVFLTFTPPQFNWCFCKLSFRVYTFSHFSHSNLLSKWVFMCLAISPFATLLSQMLHFSIVWTFPMCFFKIYAVWNFLSQMLQLDSFFWWYSL